MSPAIAVVEPGLFTTVQDLGRYGFQRYGVPVSGAMDSFALRAANLLAGNDEDAAGLEMTVIGPTLEFEGDAVIAVTGADLTAMLDGSPLPRWEAVRVTAGSRVSFHGMADGIRGYLAVSGGIDVPEVMGSRSTYVKGGFGGLNGSALSAGDALDTLPATGPARAFPPDFQSACVRDGARAAGDTGPAGRGVRRRGYLHAAGARHSPCRWTRTGWGTGWKDRR